MKSRYPYNDDLPEEGKPSGAVAAQYEPIAFALFFPALVDKVKVTDTAATRAKRRVRRNGLASIGLVTLALLGASAAPLYQEHLWSRPIVFLFAIMGIAGGLLGFLNRSDDWLQHRLATECLRQLYFRLLIELAPEILQGVSGDKKRFEAKRAAALAAFDQDVTQRGPSLLESLIEQTGPPPATPIDPMPSPALLAGPDGQTLLRAYRNLRIVKQRQYADHKLLMSGGPFSPFPRAQAAGLSLLGLICVGLLFGTHIWAALEVTLREHHSSPWLHVVPVWIAIAALAIRALEEGLRPRADVERYRHYQAAIRRILERFDGGDTAAKLRSAEELERAAFDEMVIFLRAYREAHFVL